MTKVIKDAGYPLLNGPRFTGDGYESVIGDPEGNQIEITIYPTLFHHLRIFPQIRRCCC